jgi:ribonuclease D
MTQPPVPSIALVEPADGVPEVIADEVSLAAATQRLAAGVGPIAVDAERASGYRYGQRAYLIQLRREGTGTLLIDPIPLGQLTGLQAVMRDAEWVLHAAHQDFPCLGEVGLHADRLFDTELAARLAGFERVGLAHVTARLLGFTLEKGYSAADWSTRPLPADWLRYAALDVELLIELREMLAQELARQGKLGWAEQEFAAAVAAPPKPAHPEPWRRTSGIHRVRNRRQLGLVRALWYARDTRARARDIAPGRVLPDSAILGAALAFPRTKAALAALPIYSGPRMRRTLDFWWDAIDAASKEPDSALPGPAVNNGLPPAGRWADRDPEAAARLVAVRFLLKERAAEHTLPVENLLEPALQRRMAWTPPDPLDTESVAAELREGAARPWQVELCADAVARALRDPAPFVAAAQEAAEEAARLAAQAETALEADATMTEAAS